MAKLILTKVFQAMPLLFGLGFLGPLFGEILQRTGLPLPGGIPPLLVGMAIGGLWGAIALRTGRWL
ncbi:MAG: hypothetical protein EBS42_15850 [Caulobacteraceae bacterium]|jgi:hypothetical protein|nr:hypothetical protein [Caulobacteraceae bacterium]